MSDHNKPVPAPPVQGLASDDSREAWAKLVERVVGKGDEVIDSPLPVHDEVLIDYSGVRPRGEPLNPEKMRGIIAGQAALAALGPVKIITDPEVTRVFYPAERKHESATVRANTLNGCNEIVLGEATKCALPRPKDKLLLTDHFDINMLRDDVSGLEQARISRGEARLFLHGNRYDVHVVAHRNEMRSVLADLARVDDARVQHSPLTGNCAYLYRHLRPGDVVIFVEQKGSKVQFWRLDVLKPTHAVGSGKKAWSW